MIRDNLRVYSGQRIGLFGGSFDPAHEGHAHVARTALRRLRLDRVWWLVTPQNPLKAESAPLGARIASAKRMARGSNMVVTAFEAAHGYHYTYQTVRALQRRFPAAHFVLIIGADSVQSLRHWRRWRELMRAAPLAVVSRPGAGARALHAKPAQTFANARRAADASLATAKPPAWTFLNARFHSESSSAMRALAEPPQR